KLGAFLLSSKPYPLWWPSILGCPRNLLILSYSAGNDSSASGKRRARLGNSRRSMRRTTRSLAACRPSREQKAKLIGGRTQVRGGLLDCLGEIKTLLALETIKHRGRLEGFLLDGVKNI